jgi:hypothetical protein
MNIVESAWIFKSGFSLLAVATIGLKTGRFLGIKN